eukprot:5772365-Amphidinium_carterae.1
MSKDVRVFLNVQPVAMTGVKQQRCEEHDEALRRIIRDHLALEHCEIPLDDLLKAVDVQDFIVTRPLIARSATHTSTSTSTTTAASSRPTTISLPTSM